MSTGVIRISAALFALALLVGVFGLNTQPTQAILEVGVDSNWASVPSARAFSYYTLTFAHVVADIDGQGIGTDDGDQDPVEDLPAVSGDRDRHTLTRSTRTIQMASGGAEDGTTLVDSNIEIAAIGDEGFVLGSALTAALALPAGEDQSGDADAQALFDAREEALDAERPMAMGNNLMGLAEDSYVDDWVEVLTGPAAGMVGLITGYNTDGTLTFDSARGLHPTAQIMDGDMYRIVEENPTRTVMVEIYNEHTADNPIADPLEISVQNSSVGGTQPAFTYSWTDQLTVGTEASGTGDDAVAKAPAIFKFDLMPQNSFTTRMLEVDVSISGDDVTVTGVDDDADRDLNEPNDYWKGRTLTGSTTTTDEPPVTTTETRLIVASGNNSLTISHAFGVTYDDYWINIEEVPAYEDQTVSFQYGIFRRNVTTDKISPIVSSVSPGKGAVVQDGDILFEADVIDVSSGYSSDEDSIDNVSQIANGKIALEILGNIIPGDDITWTKISDGWRLSYENSFGTPGQTVNLKWRIIARDKAGAQYIEDRTTSTTLITVDGKDPEFKANNSQRSYNEKDYPNFDRQLLQSRTGDNWRAANAADERWRMGGMGSHDPPVRVKSENRKGVLVLFDEEGGLDVSTVDATDFSVDGVTPTSVTVVDAFEDSQKDPSSSRRRPQEVFLVMPSNLPSDGKDADDNRLEVTLSGTIRDVAGNNARSDTIVLVDGIPPRITVVIDDADQFDQEEITVNVSVDETLLQAPTLTVRQSTSTSLVDGENVSADSATPIMDNTASQAYAADIDITDGATVPVANQASLINIVVNAIDVASNEEEAGDDDDWTEANAYTFELDPELNNGMAPGVTVAGSKIFDGELLDSTGAATGDDAEIEVVDPLLITIDFGRECADDRVNNGPGCDGGGEAKEYAGDTHKTIELSGVDVDVDLADGNSASPDPTISTSDNIVYTLSIRNPPVGDYTISFRAADEAGNVSLTSGAAIAETLESEFTVKAAVPTELALTTGWNLISLPFQPANPGINSVLPPDHPATLVMSYDNASGLWLVSRRDADTGMFVGDVGQMVATTAYFIFSESLQPIKLIRPSLATASAAPAIPGEIAVKVGWNLLPVLTLESPLPGDPPGSGAVSADDYLGALRTEQGLAGWRRAMLWNTSTQQWDAVQPNTTVTRGVGDTNPCTGEALDATDVTNGEEPCQAKQDHNGFNFRNTTVAAVTDEDAAPMQVFDGNDTVVMEEHLPLGAGIWVWSLVDGQIFPVA